MSDKESYMGDLVDQEADVYFKFESKEE